MPDPASAESLPRTDAQIALAAEARGLVVPMDCIPGVVANLALLASHVDTLIGREETARA